jgi:hypothetical protein
VCDWHAGEDKPMNINAANPDMPKTSFLFLQILDAKLER